MSSRLIYMSSAGVQIGTGKWNKVDFASVRLSVQHHDGIRVASDPREIMKIWPTLPSRFKFFNHHLLLPAELCGSQIEGLCTQFHTVEEDISAYKNFECEKKESMTKRVENFEHQQMRDPRVCRCLRRLHGIRKISSELPEPCGPLERTNLPIPFWLK